MKRKIKRIIALVLVVVLFAVFVAYEVGEMGVAHGLLIVLLDIVAFVLLVLLFNWLID
jgi:hypothetical protein